jgi:hypothetical protein
VEMARLSSERVIGIDRSDLMVDFARKEHFRQLMQHELRAQNDPRQFGGGGIFDRYVYADEMTRNFYERFMRGEKLTAGWVNPSDFEKAGIK